VKAITTTVKHARSPARLAQLFLASILLQLATCTLQSTAHFIASFKFYCCTVQLVLCFSLCFKLVVVVIGALRVNISLQARRSARHLW